MPPIPAKRSMKRKAGAPATRPDHGVGNMRSSEFGAGLGAEWLGVVTTAPLSLVAEELQRQLVGFGSSAGSAKRDRGVPLDLVVVDRPIATHLDCLEAAVADLVAER